MQILVLIPVAALAAGCVVAPPAPVAVVEVAPAGASVGDNVGIGIGGASSTIVNNRVVNYVSQGAAPAVTHHAGFAAAHPGFMAGLRAAGQLATVAARVGGAAGEAKAVRNP